MWMLNAEIQTMLQTTICYDTCSLTILSIVEHSLISLIGTCHCIHPCCFARPLRQHPWFCKFLVVGRKPEFILAGNFVYVFLDKNRISQHKTQSGIVLHTYRSMGDRPNRYIVGHGCFCDVAYFIFGGWSRCSDTYFKDGGMKWLIY